jgi:CRISPR-associated protein Csh2
MLMIYDAKQCNPNGDIDNENKPRMDYDTNTNLVSDVKIKRYIRDYAAMNGNEIFITNEAEDAKKRLKDLGVSKDKNIERVYELIDVKLFGVVTANENATSLTGPVQFNWAYSLNPVEIQESSTITSSFSSGHGIGKDFRVNYSLLAVNGSINAKITQKYMYKEKYYGLNNEDIKFLDDAMINAIQANRTRSKIGQTPRFYLRVEGINDKIFLNDLREYIGYSASVSEEKIRNISEITIDTKNLIEYLKFNKAKISKLYYWKDYGLKISNDISEELGKEFEVVNL